LTGGRFRDPRQREMLGCVGGPTRGPVHVGGDGIVGRRRELDALRVWLDAARDGAGRLVLRVGEPGIDKTRLAQELAGVALAGDTAAAWGRCVEVEGAPAFWPWRQVLRSLGVDPDAVLGVVDHVSEQPAQTLRQEGFVDLSGQDLGVAEPAVADDRGGL